MLPVEPKGRCKSTDFSPSDMEGDWNCPGSTLCDVNEPAITVREPGVSTANRLVTCSLVEVQGKHRANGCSTSPSNALPTQPRSVESQAVPALSSPLTYGRRKPLLTSESIDSNHLAANCNEGRWSTCSWDTSGGLISSEIGFFDHPGDLSCSYQSGEDFTTDIDISTAD